MTNKASVPEHTEEIMQLYEKINEHLLADDEPSMYLKKAESQKEFALYPFSFLHALIKVEQSPKYHPEGSAWNHTLLVVDEAAKVKTKSEDPRAFLWAALLHDIGKTSTTRKHKGKITSYNHDQVGAELAREFLSVFTDDMEFIGKVSILVKFHMHILYVVKDLPYARIQEMKRQANVDEIALLGLCDRLGRLDYNRKEEENNIDVFLRKVTSFNHQSNNQ